MHFGGLGDRLAGSLWQGSGLSRSGGESIVTTYLTDEGQATMRPTPRTLLALPLLLLANIGTAESLWTTREAAEWVDSEFSRLEDIRRNASTGKQMGWTCSEDIHALQHKHTCVHRGSD